MTSALTRSMVAASFGLSNTSANKLPTLIASSSLKPRVVIAGLPKRIPEVTNGFSGSLGMEFLLQVMCAEPKTASAALPVMFLERKSTNMTWDSVPPEMMRRPRLIRVFANASAFLTTCSW